MEPGLTLSVLGPLAVAARVSLRSTERRLAIIAKASCEIEPEGPLSLVPPRPIVDEEQSVGAPGAGVVHPGDLALRVNRAQILVVGAAYAEGGIPVTSDTVRLVVSRGSATLVDKGLSVVGDRRGLARRVPSARVELVEQAVPFLRIPIVYERAFGGEGSRSNPVGTGMAEGHDGRAPLPNVYRLGGRAGVEPAGFGPISSLWPARLALLAGTPASSADVELVARLAPEFSYDYFLSAPADQRFDQWAGGETVALHHMHPSWPWLRFEVPRWGVAAVLTDRRGCHVVIPMPLDTLLVTPDDLSVELTFRGDVDIDIDTLRGARVDVALADETDEQTPLPGYIAVAGAIVPAASVSSQQPEPTQRLARLELEPVVPPPGDPTTRKLARLDIVAPYDRAPDVGEPHEPPSRTRGGTMVLETAPRAAAAPTPEPSESDEPPRRRGSRTHSGTMILEQAAPSPHDPRAPFVIEDEVTHEWDGDELLREATVSFTLEDLAPDSLPFERPAPRPRAMTISLEEGDEAPPSLPFDRRLRGISSRARPDAPIPGAPWSPGGAPAPKRAAGIEQTEGDETHADSVRTPMARPAPMARSAVAPEATIPSAEPVAAAPDLAKPTSASEPRAEVASAQERVDKATVWRVDPPEPPPGPPSPAPARRGNFKAGLYKNVKK